MLHFRYVLAPFACYFIGRLLHNIGNFATIFSKICKIRVSNCTKQDCVAGKLVFNLANDFLTFGKGNKDTFHLRSANGSKAAAHCFWLSNGKLRCLVVVRNAFPKLCWPQTFVQGIKQQTALYVRHDDVFAICFVFVYRPKVALNIGVKVV